MTQTRITMAKGHNSVFHLWKSRGPMHFTSHIKCAKNNANWFGCFKDMESQMQWSLIWPTQ